MASDSISQNPEQSDSDLLRQYAVTRSEAAIGALVRRHLGFVYNVALRKVGGDMHLAEDVAQRVFADLAAKASSLKYHPHLAGWLFTGTHYVAGQLVRTERRRKARERRACEVNEILREAPPPVQWEALRPLLDDLVLSLSERDREAVLLRYFEGRSFAELGARLQLTDNGARARVERAVEKLRSMLARRGITSTHAALGMALAEQATAAAPAALAASVTSSAIAATGTAGALAAAFAFMNTAKIVTLGVTLLALAAGGISLYIETNQTAAVLPSAPGPGGQFHGTVQSLPRNGAVEVSGHFDKKDALSMENAQDVAGFLKADEQQLSDPRSSYLLRRTAERAVMRKYGYVFDHVDLTPHVRKALKELLSQRHTHRYDWGVALGKEGIMPPSSTYARAQAEERKEFEARLQALCGPDYPSVQRLLSLSGQMSHISIGLAPQFDFAGVPLTDSQILELAGVMEEVGFMPGRLSFAEAFEEAPDPSTGLIPLYNNLALRTASLLTPEQIAVLKQDQDRLLAIRQTTRK